ncbi:MAG: VCBS repeat-containing protein [Myxococcales bacterium]|nr:VCBS repeat-containing protein [Myxococcales bacterium]
MGILRSAPLALLLMHPASCGGDGGNSSGPLPDAGGPIEPPAPSCAAGASGTESASEPQRLSSIAERWHEGWLASPAVADLDGDGTTEIVVARSGRLSVWHADGSLAWQVDIDGRIWASPIVGDLLPATSGLEVVVASREVIHLYDAAGNLMPGYPFTWRDELRSLAAGDIDGDGRLEIVAVTHNRLEEGGKRDIVIAIEAAGGELIEGFPPNTTGASGCDDACYVTGGYDQNLALGDVNGDGAADIFATQDNAYLSLHEGDGSVTGHLRGPGRGTAAISCTAHPL